MWKTDFRMKARKRLLYMFLIFHCALLFPYSAFLLHNCRAETRETRLIYPKKAQTNFIFCRHKTENSCLSPVSDSPDKQASSTWCEICCEKASGGAPQTRCVFVYVFVCGKDRHVPACFPERKYS